MNYQFCQILFEQLFYKKLMYTFCILFQYFLQKKSITKHWTRPGVDATMATDYLCLGSGHNDMSKCLADYLGTKFGYEVDVVSILKYL